MIMIVMGMIVMGMIVLIVMTVVAMIAMIAMMLNVTTAIVIICVGRGCAPRNTTTTANVTTTATAAKSTTADAAHASTSQTTPSDKTAVGMRGKFLNRDVTTLDGATQFKPRANKRKRRDDECGGRREGKVFRFVHILEF